MNSKLSKNLVCYNKNYGHYWSYSHFETQAEDAKEPIKYNKNIGKFNTSQNVIISFDLSKLNGDTILKIKQYNQYHLI